MEIRRPDYYDRFICLAGACPDSCCQMWDVQVDEESAQRYLSLPGALGERLQQVLRQEEDGWYLMQEDGRCPMWRQDGLCRIQKELGEEALCHVCTTFPRLRHEYGCMTELGLELSCPEAARLILENNACTLLSAHNQTAAEPASEEMELLLRSREEAFRILTDGRYAVEERLALLLLFAHGVQSALDGGEERPFDRDTALETIHTFATGGDIRSLVHFYQSLEILTSQWEERLKAPPAPTSWEEGHIALALYFVLRYWLQAVSDYDLVGRVKLTLSACLLIRSLGGDLAETAQSYSKEIENDIDNVDALLDAAWEEPAFTDAALLDLLLK